MTFNVTQRIRGFTTMRYVNLRLTYLLTCYDKPIRMRFSIQLSTAADSRFVCDSQVSFFHSSAIVNFDLRT